MKNITKIMAATMMMAVLMVGTSFAGVIINDLKGDDKQSTCTQQKTKRVKGVILQDFTGVIVNGITGVIVNGFTGVIVNGFTGVIVNGATDGNTNCGVIVNG